jgi:hypothetical protein
MRINEHQIKGCEKAVDFERNPLTLKLYPPLQNATESMYLMKGGNILEYQAKNTLHKIRHIRPSSTLTL